MAMDFPCFDDIPKELHQDALRLWEHSPLFASLMRDASSNIVRQVFQTKENAVLPQANHTWFPKTDACEPDDCMRHLRTLKRNAMRHIIWWELGIHGDIERSYHAISATASALLRQALDMTERLMAPRFGRLKETSFCVIGLGKLGGQELNLGSDIDLLFVWQGDGRSEGGRKSVPVNEYYHYFSRMLIRLLSEWTEDGLVWPVDMRLRPGGDGSAICLNLEATLSHYLEYGQTWERAMLIKARPIAGDLALGKAFVAGVSPFIYRRYLDYSSVAALADMKRRIDAQAGLKAVDAGFDVKKGRGGIREIEFIIQSLQLIHGGRDASLQVNESKHALNLLADKGLIEKSEARGLVEAYLFWRRVEHAIQARKGEQTQLLPQDYQSYLETVLATQNIQHQMLKHSRFVASSFQDKVLPITNNNECDNTSWLHGDCLQKFTTLKEDDKTNIKQSLQHIDKQLLRGILPERSRQHIETILQIAMPQWLKSKNGVYAVQAFADLLHAISGRATWIDLLATHRATLDWLIDVLSASRYLSSHLIKNPSWLEWPLENERGEVEIKRLCTRIDRLENYADEEQFLRDLGKLVDQARVQCALTIHAEHSNVLAIGGWLADIADSTTRACLRSALYQLHLPADFGLVALALGKHGSREMGLVSDLDMVFVLTEKPNLEINGRSAREWAQRLGRRMIRQITGNPPFGAGYEFDARLRPSGNSGVLVTTLEGFYDYQTHDAQTWEHQALCRARAITGSKHARQQVMDVVHTVITQPHDYEALAQDIWNMRKKMLKHLSSKDSSVINLKHDKGGLVDIEFLAQFSRLMFGGSHEGTVLTLQNIPKKAQEAWKEAGKSLASAYLNYRQMENILRVELWQSIGKLPNQADTEVWKVLQTRMPDITPLVLKNIMADVHNTFLQLLHIHEP